MNVVKPIVGEIYVGIHKHGKEYIYEFNKNNSYNGYINIEDQTYIPTEATTYSFPNNREATHEQKRHFLACRKAKKYVECPPKDEVINDFQIY